MTHEEAKAQVHERGWGKITPYRIGIVMGEADGAAFVAWRDACREAKNWSAPRPDASPCPYDNRHSIGSWDAGRRIGMNKAGAT